LERKEMRTNNMKTLFSWFLIYLDR
jgi:hypothetical protein